MTIDTGALDTPVGPHEDEPHGDGFNNRLNWLRAGVLGGNDGIVSTAGIVMGVAGATERPDDDPGRGHRRPGGRRAEHGGAGSTSRSAPSATPSGRCSPRSARSSRDEPEEELAELAGLYVEQGAQRAAGARGRRGADRPRRAGRPRRDRARHRPRRPDQPVARRVGLDAGVHRSGALLPLLTITLTPAPVRVWATVAAVGRGARADRLGLAPDSATAPPAAPSPATSAAGVLAMAVTYGIGALLGTQIG